MTSGFAECGGYLASSEIAFRHFGFMNFQIQLTKRIEALPITRDYMIESDQLADAGQSLPSERAAA
jgi:cyclopropane-fatty-acyl-phospholipid synthase